MSGIKCLKYRCPHYEIDVYSGSGGTIETCRGIVIRETGHWTDEKDREYTLCNVIMK